jgi:hypothetical protein
MILAGCRVGGPSEPPLFVLRSPGETGIDFANQLAEAASFNIFHYPYYYNGGGVAAGDVNGDGWIDLYFTANELPNRLYLGRGDFQFEDATEAAGVAGTGNWSNGAVMADVNGDSRLDLYVTNLGGFLDRTGRNELFVNEGADAAGIPRFAERAAEYGLDFEGYATHAAFLDYDRDGDLDVYLLNHSTHTERTYRPAEAVREPHERAGDRLLRNDGARFTDVTREAGIYSGAAGYGLSIAVADFDDDDWPDLYVGNDFHENDFLYQNRGDGTFAEIGTRALPHTSTFSMGSDAGDIDGDGRTDLVVLDMLPDREDIRKTSAGADVYSLYELKRQLGYHHQLPRNTLQLNRGVVDGVPRFSDIAYLAGVSATDWSWAPLLADFDRDGWLDLFVTNGIYRRPNDLDYINYVSNEVVQQSLRQGQSEASLALLGRMPTVPLPNYAFRNAGGYRFEDISTAWGLDEPGFSNGAAYADLDNDGDLDLILNHINAPAGIYENRAERQSGWHGLTLVLQGRSPNTMGIGTAVRLFAGGRMITAYQSPSRGFLSSVDPRLFLGLGAVNRVDSLVVTWPDGSRQMVFGVETDQVLTLRQEEARPGRQRPSDVSPWFREIDLGEALPYRHEENDFVDFNRELLMPHKRSTDGPAAAAGDVDGDGRVDLYLGGAKYQPGRLLVQQANGAFRSVQEDVFRADSLAEDVDAAFFDADGDGDADLYVVSGGNEYWGEAEPLRDRFYRNEAGAFVRDTTALPRFFASGSTVAPADVDGDGDLDLFVGSRTVPRRYGEAPASFFLRNDGRGRFRDATSEHDPSLAAAGMVADAAWFDLEGDGDPDLVLAGEWMPIRIFRNDAGRLAEATSDAGLANTAGWWNTLLADDLDGDGDFDLVAGNQGLNTQIQASAWEPARYHRADFDRDGEVEGVLALFRGGVSYPDPTLDLLRQSFPDLRRQDTSYADFGARRMDALFGRSEREGETVLEATQLASVWAENDGTGRFVVHELPSLAQLSPTFALHVTDVDADGRKDLLLAGNFTGVRPDRGREDAGYGLWLRQTASGRFEPVDLSTSGLVVDGEVRAILEIGSPEASRLLFVRNDDVPAGFEMSGVLRVGEKGRP